MSGRQRENSRNTGGALSSYALPFMEMIMPNFFAEETHADGFLTLRGEDAYHIARALRMAVGDGVTVCANGVPYPCVLERIRDDECLCRITGDALPDPEPPFPVTLYMAFPKGDKLETVVQKATELGATRIVPFLSSRCIRRPGEEKTGRLTERLRRIAAEAAKQCGRARIPAVDAPLSFAAMLEEGARAALPLFCYEGTGTVPLRTLLEETAAPASVCAVVGSEGGFSPEEAEAARSAGFRMAGLGRRILRCETAPAYVLSALDYRYGTPGEK